MADDEFPHLRVVFGAAVACAAATVAALLLVGVYAPAGWLPHLLFAAVGFYGGGRVGYRASTRPDLSTADTVGLGVLAWVFLFPFTYVATFALLQRVLLAALPSRTAALTPMFLGAAVFVLIAIGVLAFGVALVGTLLVGVVRGRTSRSANAE